MSAYKHLASFDGEHERAWLCRIASNKCIDYLKKAGRRSIPTDDEFFIYVPGNTDTPEESYLHKEVQEKLYRCCDSLKPPYRDVALDYFYHELDIREMVQKTGKNIKTLQTQIYRAKAMLRKSYGDALSP